MEEFAAHIRQETDKARAEVEARVADLSQVSVGCVDKLTRKGQWNPPGGLVFLYNEEGGLLEKYVANRRGKKGKLYAHLRCGYMRVVMGIETAAEQDGVIKAAEVEVERLNQQYGTKFKVVVEPQGSAAAYMRG